MKKIFGLIMAIMAVGFISCSDGNSSSDDNDGDDGNYIEGYGWYKLTETYNGNTENLYIFFRFDRDFNYTRSFGNENMKYDRHLNTSDFDPFLQKAIDVIQDPDEHGTAYYDLKELVKSEYGKNHNAALKRMSEPPSWALFEEGWYYTETDYAASWKDNIKFYIYTKADGTITRVGCTSDNEGFYNREWTKQDCKEEEAVGDIFNRNFYGFYDDDWEKGTAPSWAE